MVEYQVRFGRVETISDTDTVSNATLDIFAQDVQRGDADVTGEVTLSPGEEATISIDIIDNGNVIASDSTTASVVSSASSPSTFFVNQSVSDESFDVIEVSHTGDGTATFDYTVEDKPVILNELNNVVGSTTINPFGDRFVCEFLDNEGNKFDQVSVDNAVEILARDPTPSNQADNSFNSIFEGYVVQADEGQEGSRDSLEVTIYSFDQIIRNERVSNDQSGNSISTALEDIIKVDTPVEYVAGNVSVGDNRTLNRPLQGLTVEEALRVLSLRSENENYGVNNNREFFFRPRVESSGKKDITDNDVTNYSVPERGKESKNEVTVNYNNDNERVTVSNGSNQLNIQDSLGTQDPVGFPDEISRPSITDRQEALAEGREFLRQRENTLAGRVTVVGDTDFLSNDVGDTVNVTITPRGIDDEFVLVGKEVDYIRNEISFDIIQKRGDQDSLLKAIGQQLKREELSGTDQGTPSDKVTQTNVRVDIEQSYSGVDVTSSKVTTICRNQLREAWLNDESVEITTAVIGTSTDVLRSTTNLNTDDTTSTAYNEVAYNTLGYGVSTGVDLTPISNDQLEVNFDLGGSGDVLGFKDVDGDLLFIAQLDSTVSNPNGTLTITINDGETDKSVLTNTGQEAIRDLFRGTYSIDATKVEYGDSGTEPQESDTSISTEIKQEYSFTKVDIDSQTEWETNTSITTDDRVYIENGFVKLAQTGFISEAENADDKNSSNFTDANASNGSGEELLSGTDQFIEFTFDLNYEIPGDEWDIIFRGKKASDNGTAHILSAILDSSEISTFRFGNLNYEWSRFTGDSSALSPGSKTLRFEVDTIADDNVIFDLFGLIDTRYYDSVGSFDNTLNSDGYLADPQLYPESESFAINTQNFSQEISSATLTTQFNNTENGQFVELSNGSTQTNTNNQSVSLTDISTQTINATLGLDGFGTRTDGTPTERFNGQEVDLAQLDVDLAVLNKSDVGRADYEVIFGGSDANGLTLQEAGQVNSNGDALTRSIFPEIEPSGEAVIFSEDLGFGIS